ncbi:uncharacterized protein LODBEIA_P17800 [Lodderomyces beijingensis]|uniref:Uncharacterized protein n=1 Tax=Lodderomyces beijingensis TaxID=1775926 RepID=A0ABP0ZHB5_9ASCO
MAEISAKSIKSDLEDLTSQKYSFLRARQDFENSNVSNPKGVEAGVDEWKRIFSRLTFDYQERTIREEFLRKLSSLSKDQLSKINDEVKQALEVEFESARQKSNELESERRSKIDELVVISNEVSSLYTQFQTSKSQIEANVAEAAALEEEIEHLLNEENIDKEVLRYMLDNEVEDLRAPPSQESKDEVEDEVKQVEVEIEGTENRYHEEVRKLEALDEKIKSLQAQIHGKEPVDNELQRQTLWFKEMTRILTSLGGVETAD